MREKTVRYLEIPKVEIFWELGIQSTFIIRPIPFLYYLLHLCTFSHHRVRCSKAPLQYSAMCITKFIFKFTLLFEVMQYSTEADCNGEDFFHFVIDRYLVGKTICMRLLEKTNFGPKQNHSCYDN